MLAGVWVRRREAAQALGAAHDPGGQSRAAVQRTLVEDFVRAVAGEGRLLDLHPGLRLHDLLAAVDDSVPLAPVPVHDPSNPANRSA